MSVVILVIRTYSWRYSQKNADPNEFICTFLESIEYARFTVENKEKS